MTKLPQGWGLGLFLAAGLHLPAALFLVYRLAPGSYPGLYNLGLPAATLLFALLCLAATLTAYPRVRNLHILLPGTTVAAAAAVQALTALAPPFAGRTELRIWLPLLLQISLPAAVLLPSLVNPRLLRKIGGLWSLLLTAAALPALLHPAAGDLLERLALAPPLPPLLIQSALVIATVAVTLIRLKAEFSLGGLIAGLSLLTGLSWLTAIRPGARDLSAVLTAALPLFTAVGVLLHRMRRMEHRALYDPLLQIYNRGYCDSILSEGGGVSTAPPFAVALFDLDHFKKINDTHGHQAGDAVLYETAQTIRNGLIPDGILCRYGGEELVAIFPGRSGRELLGRLEECRRAVEGLRIDAGERKIAVTVSCGAADRRERNESPAEVLKRADAALYRAKQAGRNRIELDEKRSPERAAKGPARRSPNRAGKAAKGAARPK